MAPTRFGQLFEGYASTATMLKKITAWMVDAPADDPIDPALLPDVNYGRALNRAVQRMRDNNRTRDSSPRGTAH
jgi:hypothetical protein